jgi:hypothetical protein
MLPGSSARHASAGDRCLIDTWHGDANLDGEFDSSDMATAFVDGGYEQGPRADAAAVPEPLSFDAFALGLLLVFGVRHRQK